MRQISSLSLSCFLSLSVSLSLKAYLRFKNKQDTINNTILAGKLSHYGLSDSCVQHLPSFLTGRGQSVSFPIDLYRTWCSTRFYFGTTSIFNQRSPHKCASWNFLIYLQMTLVFMCLMHVTAMFFPHSSFLLTRC